VSRVSKIAFAVSVGLWATACSSVKVPDIVDLPEFGDSVANAENFEYLDPMNAPEVPDDMKSSTQWDKAAKAMIRKRENFNAPIDVDGALTEQQIKQEIEALKSKVKEYKLDDPIE